MRFGKVAVRAMEWFGCLGIGVPAALLLLFCQSGCSTMKPMEEAPDELQQKIRAGALVAVGDRVAIVTNDGHEHRFVVTGIDDTQISGKEVRIPIDTIAGLSVREFSVGRTVVLTTGVGVTGAVLMYFAAMSAGAVVLAGGI